MDQAQIEFETAIDMARRGREAWLENPTRENFQVWRDSSETAHRWHRTMRLAGKAAEVQDAELDKILSG